MPKYKITVSYDGRDFLGWQRHGDKPTIQFSLERAIEEAFGCRVPIKGSGRTDRGAHASGQVISVDIPTEVKSEEIVTRLNDVIVGEIKVVAAEKVTDDFDACDSAVGKRYGYVIWNDLKLPKKHDGRVWHVKTPLVVEDMLAVASVFEGEHDFASFATKPNFKQKSTTRTIHSVVIEHDLPFIIIDICADGFLYKMVRNIVRAIVKVGEGRYTADDVRAILKAKDRKAAPGTAPASGLYLERVFYSQDELLADSKENK